MSPQELTLGGLAVTPLLIALVQVAKEAGLPSRLAPVAALVLGVAAGIAAQYTLPHPNPIIGLVAGVAAGLSAAGLYAGISTFVQPNSDTPVVPPSTAPSSDVAK